jgi:hypothetical protein
MAEKKWIKIYQKAILELEHAKMRGRIGDARDEIVMRVEKLKSIPGLHDAERRAIDDALNALRFLEQVEDRYDQHQRWRLLERAARELQYLAPRIEKLDEATPE